VIKCGGAEVQAFPLNKCYQVFVRELIQWGNGLDAVLQGW